MSRMSDEDRDELVAYLDGELDEASTQALEARISQDATVRAELDSLKQVYGLLDYLPRPEPSGSFTHRTMERLSLHQPRQTGKMPTPGRRWMAAGLWAAAVVAVFALGWLGSRLLWKAPPAGKGPAPPKGDAEELLVRHLRLFERFREYQNVEDIDFLRALDDPMLFGEDVGG
ncbi:MAG: hypothetical protein U0793_27925 [Gemmataceae bacterium]